MAQDHPDDAGQYYKKPKVSVQIALCGSLKIKCHQFYLSITNWERQHTSGGNDWIEIIKC